MKALVYEGPEILSIQEKEVPEPGKGEVRVKIGSCGICGSDTAGYTGKTGRRLPGLVMGHEFGGVVDKLGEGVEAPAAGTRVAVFPILPCGECDFCKEKLPMLCESKEFYGVLSKDGAFTEYLNVPAENCYPIPDSMTDDEAALGEPLAVASRGVSKLGDLTGKSVLVVGAGTIGLLALCCVKAKGASKIFIADMVDSRLALAKELGADIPINTGKENAVEVIKANTDGRGCDCSIECVGITPTAALSVEAVRVGGTISWVGNNRPLVEIGMQQIVTKEKKLFGSYLYSREDFANALALLADKKIDADKLVTGHITLDEAPAKFDELVHNPGNNVKVIVRCNP